MNTDPTREGTEMANTRPKGAQRRQSLDRVKTTVTGKCGKTGTDWYWRGWHPHPRSMLSLGDEGWRPRTHWAWRAHRSCPGMWV